MKITDLLVTAEEVQTEKRLIGYKSLYGHD